jgi:hypothetical protein
MCNTGTQCLACQSGYFMNSSMLCSKECPPRFYPSQQTYSCQNCPYDCLTCDSSGKCLSCDPNDNRVLFPNVSRCLAMPTFYDNKTTMCRPCPSSCYLCQSLTYCINCRPGYFLDLNFQCVVDCPAYYYRDNTTLTCVGCPYDCLNCDSNGQCTVCNINTDMRTLNDGTKRCIPKVGYFDNKTRVAASCMLGCSAC